ncbi:MAG: hypothetical protein AB1752_08555 [Candidatus Zixiibacteriota bacterium]
MRLHRGQWILLWLALAATGVVIGAGMHGHHQDDHSTCWLCVSSFASHALPALTFVIALTLSVRIFHRLCEPSPAAALTASPAFPRAPPLLFS